MFHKTLGWVIPILTIAVAGISFTSGAGTQPLLRRGTRTIGPGFAEKIQIPKAAILRARPIRFQLNALRSKMKPVALATSQQRRLVLNLFDNVSVTAVADRIKGKKGADITWAGRLEGRRPGHAVLLVRKNKLYGNVRVGRKLYMIRPRAGGGQSVTEVDTAKLPDEGPDHLADRIDRSRPDGAGSDSDVGRRHGSHVNELINVMVVYTPQAKEAAESAGSDIEAEIELAVEDTNQTYINSGISLRLILAHTSEVSYTDSGKFGSKGNQIGDLKRLREKSDGKMDGVHRIRNRVYADLVSLWTGIGDHCGLAHRMKSVGVSFGIYIPDLTNLPLGAFFP